MTEREKIISLANSCGASTGKWGDGAFTCDQIVAFYHAAIADFLASSGLYVTNDLTRKYALKEARNEVYEKAAEIADSNCEDEPYGHAKFRCVNIATAIRSMKEQS